MIPRWLRRLLRIHSPSGHLLGTCWCQPDPAIAQAIADDLALHQALVDAYLASVEARQPYRVTYETEPGSTTVTLDNTDGQFHPDGPRSNGWECSHAGEPCRCDETLTCICAPCTRKRWPNGPDDA